MREKAGGDRPEIVLEIEAHRKPRRIGREAEDEEAHALRQVGLEIRDRPPLADRLKNGPDFLRLDAFVDPVGAEQSGEDAFRLLRRLGVGGVRPKDRRGVADLDAMAAALFEEAVERRRVGESRRLRDRSVFALLVAVGREGVEIEGNDRSSRRLRAPHALDRGVQPRDRAALAGDEAGGLRSCHLQRGAASTAPAPQGGRGCKCFSVARFPARRRCSDPSSPPASRGGQNRPETRIR